MGGLEISSEFLSETNWQDKVDVRALDSETRKKILEVVRDKYGFNEAFQRLGISRASLFRYVTGDREVPDEVVRAALRLISLEDFEKIARGLERLRALGIVKDVDGKMVVDYNLVMEILSLAAGDSALRSLIISFVARRFADELQKAMGRVVEPVELHWSKEFEEFLRSKKGRKVLDSETIAKYRNLFTGNLEGRTLSRELIDEVAKSNNGWLRVVLRHYARFLAAKKLISRATLEDILDAVPSRQYSGSNVVYNFPTDDNIRRTMEFLWNKHRLYYTIYRLMLESGARLKHALLLLSTWNPDEVIVLPKTATTSKRLVLEVVEIRVKNNDKSSVVRYPFYRYFLGAAGGTKRADWLFFSTKTKELLETQERKTVRRELVTKFAESHELVLPKMIRKVAWDRMVKVLGYDVAAFLHSRFGELPVSALRYENLLRSAVEAYPYYLMAVEPLVEVNDG